MGSRRWSTPACFRPTEADYIYAHGTRVRRRDQRRRSSLSAAHSGLARNGQRRGRRGPRGAGVLHVVRLPACCSIPASATPRMSSGSSGFLMRSNKLMYDRTTYTLWNQLTGELVLGKLADGSTRAETPPGRRIDLAGLARTPSRHPGAQPGDRPPTRLHARQPIRRLLRAALKLCFRPRAQSTVYRTRPGSSRSTSMASPHAYATADVVRERVVNDQRRRHGGRGHRGRTRTQGGWYRPNPWSGRLGRRVRKCAPTSARTRPSNPPMASSRCAMRRDGSGRSPRMRWWARTWQKRWTGSAATWPIGSAGSAYFRKDHALRRVSAQPAPARIRPPEARGLRRWLPRSSPRAGVTVRRVTSGPASYFFGYYDMPSWDISGRYLLTQRVGPLDVGDPLV